MKQRLWILTTVVTLAMVMWFGLMPAPAVAQEAAQETEVQRLYTSAAVPLTLEIIAADGVTSTVTFTVAVENWLTVSGTDVFSPTVAANLLPAEAAPSGMTLGEATLARVVVQTADSTSDNDDSISEAQAHSERGIALFEEGEYTSALAEFDQAIELEPYNAFHYVGRALAYGALEEYELALADAERVVVLAPDAPGAYTLRGRAYISTSQTELAIADFTKAIELDPEYAEPYYRRGVALRRSGEWPKAVDDFTRAIELNPDDSDSYRIRAFTHSIMGNHDLALLDFDQVIVLDPEDAGAYNNRALERAYIGEFEGALADMEICAELEGGELPPSYLDTRAFVYLSMGDDEAAQADYETALDAGMTSAYPRLGVGIAYARLGNLEEGIARINEGLALLEGADEAGFDQQLQNLVAWATEFVPTTEGDTEDDTAVDTPQAAPVTVVVNRNANLREGPGTTYAIVRVAARGEELQVVAQNADGTWLQLVDGAWISASLVDGVPADLPDAASDPTTNPSSSPAGTQDAAAREAATVTLIRAGSTRMGPGMPFPVVEFFFSGDHLTIVARNAAGGWVQVANGAWLSTYLLEEVPEGLPIVDVQAQADLSAIAPLLEDESLPSTTDTDTDTLITQLGEEIEANPARASAHYNRGTLYLEAGQYVEAIADFDQAIALAPELAEAYNNRGLAHYERSELTQAVIDFDTTLQLNPDLAQAHYNRANVHFTVGEYLDAILAYDRAIELQPDYPRAFINRGSAYHIVDGYEEAIEDLTQAIALDPTIADAYFDRGLIYADREPDLANEDFTRATELDPTYIAAYINRGLLLLYQDEYDEAIEVFTQAIDVIPTGGAYVNRGRARSGLGQDVEALQDMEEAIALAPEDAFMYLSRAIIHGQLENWLDALVDFTTVLRLDPTYVDAYYGRGFVYFMIGIDSLAIQDLETSIALAPDSPVRTEIEELLEVLQSQ